MEKKQLTQRKGLTANSPYMSGLIPIVHALVPLFTTIKDAPFSVSNIVTCIDLSDTARRKHLDNRPGIVDLCNMAECLNFFIEALHIAYELEQLTDEDIESIVVTSQYRSEKVNKAVGGSPSSLHRLGLAFDFKASEVALGKLFNLFSEFFDGRCERLAFDTKGKWERVVFPCELIHYGSYMHIGFKYIDQRSVTTDRIPF